MAAGLSLVRLDDVEYIKGKGMARPHARFPRWMVMTLRKMDR